MKKFFDSPEARTARARSARARALSHSSRASARAGFAWAALLAACFFASSASAQVAVKEPWVRATVAEQKATGAFMQLTSQQDARLIEVKSTVARVVEIHEMKMDNNVMRMRQINGLALPAGKGVELKPGGYHIMLMELNQVLKDGESVPLTLVIEGADGKRQAIELKAAVRPLAAGAHDHGAHKH